jgi:hypothetical protein
LETKIQITVTIKAMTILLEPALPCHDLKALLLEAALGVGGLEIQPQSDALYMGIGISAKYPNSTGSSARLKV